MLKILLFIFTSLVLTINLTSSTRNCTNKCRCRTWFGLNACKYRLDMRKKCKCCPGYYISADFTCEDINECKNVTGICQHICTNTLGSYYCSCKEGFYMEEDKYTCKYKTNCTNMYPQCEHFCKDLSMGPVCECKQGYKLSRDGHSCNYGRKCKPHEDIYDSIWH